MEGALYNAYKSIVVRDGENVIRYETPNAEIIEAIEEVKRMKAALSIRGEKIWVYWKFIGSEKKA